MEWSSIIVGVLALIGTVISVWAGNSKLQHKLEVNQAVTDTKIEELTREVRTHNNFAQRVPVVEEKIKEINKKVENLERKVDT